MENIKNMFLGVVVCLLFFTVQSSQERNESFSGGILTSSERTKTSEEIKYGPKTATVMRNNQTISGNIIEKEDNSITISLRCSSSCNPPCKIAWYKDGQRDTRDNPVINITLARRMSGEYQCEASGEEGNVKSHPIQVIIHYPPGDVTITPSNDTFYTKLYGKPLHDITCEADCLPKCTYRWYREGARKEDIYTNGSSLFATKSYNNNDYNRFRCVASNDINSHSSINYSKWITVEVKDGPGSLKIIPSLSARENSPLNLTCSASCYKGCRSYNWYSYSKKEWLNLNQTTSVLTFHNLSREDSGTYLCKVTDYFGQKSADYTLKVLYKTVILESRNNELTLRINETLPSDVLCKIDCNYMNCKASRSYIGVKRDSQHVRNILSGNSIFESRRSSLSDDGTYVCIANNRKSENNFKLTILHGPRTASVLGKNHLVSDITEKEDTSMTIPLKCWSRCNPPCKIAWYKDKRSLLRDNPVIDIRRDRSMSGLYHCQASGVEGIVESNPVNLTIQYPPGDVIITPGDDTFYTKRYGKPLHDITCEADCLPECTYRWYREGYSYRYTRGNKLFATRPYYYRSSSRFRCLASNAIKSYNYSRWITVKVKDGPDNVTIIPSLPAIENSSFTLTCSASCYHGCHSYSWYHNRRSMNQRTQVLEFHRLSKEDSGRYGCQVTDYFGTKSGYYNMTVQYDPKYVTIQYRSSHKHLIEGQDRLTISCYADCQPMCTYRFYQNEKLLDKRYFNEPVHRNMSGRYTCAANNSLMNAYRNSSNIQNIKIKYKPMILSTKNQTAITAPDLLDLTFSVDSFPSSNVTIFHETKTLTFLPNVTGQLSFNVSIESCLDQGEYRVEAVNDAGSDNFIFIANVKCSPIIVRYSNLSQKGYQVGDSFSYTVAYKAEPKAEVSWSFVRWNKKESKEIRKPQIQNDKEYTMIEISGLNFSNFGKYKLELKNDLGSITQEFHIQGPPQRPTGLVVDCPHSAIISWRPGFDGGTTQNFIIEYSDNSSFWQTHRSESVVPIDETFMSAQINDIQPNVPYSFRIRANNIFGVAESDTTVNCTRQNIDKMANFIDNPNALVGIGILVLLLLIATAVLLAVLKLKRKRGSNNQDNSLRKQGNESHEEDNASDIVENILYITADDAKEQIQAPEATTENPQNGSDVYAVVEKKPKPDDIEDQPVYTDVCKADQKKKKPAIAAKPSKVKKDERPTVNKDGLIYVDLDLKDTPSTSTEAFVIHGADDRTQYVDIDFTRRADPPPDTDNEQSRNEKEKEKA